MEQLEGLPGILAIAYAKELVFTQDGPPLPLKDAILIHEAKLLYQMVRRQKPRASLEIGFAYGLSTLAILKALQDNDQGHHFVIDPYERNYEYAGLAMVEKANLSHRMTFYENYLEEVYTDLPELEFAFIDNGHLFDQELFHFYLIDKKLKVGGLVGVHDAWIPSQAALVRFILKNRAYTIVNPRPPARGWRWIRGMLFSWYLYWVQEIFKRPMHYKRVEDLMFKSSTEWDNLVILRKLADDERNWKFHHPF
jgi:predicted O-methyltransferase YrrM